MIDPPWRWANWSAGHNWRAPESKYQTMTMDQVAALPVAGLLRPGGLAVVYFTWPVAADAISVVQHAWGLTIKTGGVWAKRTKNGHLRMGTGFGLRSVCEPFVLAVYGGTLPRGRSLRNMVEVMGDAAVDGLAREHSRKPDEMYALIERLTPGARRADVFSCTRRPGWEAFGDQFGKYDGGVHDARAARRFDVAPSASIASDDSPSG